MWQKSSLLKAVQTFSLYKLKIGRKIKKSPVQAFMRFNIWCNNAWCKVKSAAQVLMRFKQNFRNQQERRLITLKRELMPTTVATEVSIESISTFTNSQNQERRRSRDWSEKLCRQLLQLERSTCALLYSYKRLERSSCAVQTAWTKLRYQPSIG